jgi:hypothetical protein
VIEPESAKALRMLTRRGGTSKVRKVYDNKTCAGCQPLLVAPHIQVGYTRRHCDEGNASHRTIRCLDCGTMHHEPEQRKG